MNDKLRREILRSQGAEEAARNRKLLRCLLAWSLLLVAFMCLRELAELVVFLMAEFG